MELGRAGDTLPRAGQATADTTPQGGTARSEAKPGAGPVVSKLPVPPAGPAPSASLSPPPAFLQARARAIALAYLGKMPLPGLSAEGQALAALRAHEGPHGAWKASERPASFRLRRLETLAALLLEGGSDEEEALARLAGLERGLFPPIPGDQGSGFGGSAGGGGEGSAEAGGKRAEGGLEEDAKAFGLALTALRGRQGEGGAGNRPEGGEAGKGPQWLVLPFAFSASPPGASMDSSVEFRGFLRVQWLRAEARCLGLEAELQAGASPWRFSLGADGRWVLEGERAPLPETLRSGLGKILAGLGFGAMAAPADAGPWMPEREGLWA